MSYNILVNNSVLENIELIVLDVSGTLIDYQELWLKQIGYLSQVLAENHSTVQGELFRSRAMLMKVLGVDPETGEIDYSSSLFTSTTDEIKAILCSILYLNNVSWNTARESVNDTLLQMEMNIDLLNYTRLYPDTKKFIEKFSDKFKMASLSKRSFENANVLLDHYNIIDNRYSLFKKEPESLQKLEMSVLSTICQELDVSYKNCLIIADCMYDLCVSEAIPVNRVLIQRNNVDNTFLSRFSIKNVINSFKDIELA